MHKAKLLQAPSFISRKGMISIDEGIVDTIKYLWKNNIATLGSCQGIECTDNKPNVVIENCYTDTDIDDIIDLIKEIDERDWMVCQWRLNDVTKIRPKRHFFVGKNKL